MPLEQQTATRRALTPLEALQTLLDAVDYTTGACRFVDMIGAALPKEVLLLAKDAVTAAKKVSTENGFSSDCPTSPDTIPVQGADLEMVDPSV